MTAAELAAAEAAHVAEVSAGEMTAAELAESSAGEMTAAELAAAEAAHVAEVSAGEMTAANWPPPAAEAATCGRSFRRRMTAASMEGEATVEAVVEMVPSDEDEDRTAPPVAIIVIRIRVAPTVVVAGAIVGPVGIVAAAVRIAGRGASDATDHSGRDGLAGIIAIAVNVQLPGDGGFRPTERPGNGPHRPPRGPQNTDLVSFVLRQMRLGSHGNTP